MKNSYLRIIILLIFFAKNNHSTAQYITTIIGNGGNACYIDNQGPLCTPVFSPETVCVAINNDIYYLCGNSIKKLSFTTGIVTRIAGTDSYGYSGDGGPAIDALFQAPTSIKLDKQDNLYIVESSGNRVRKINRTTNIITTVAGNGNAGYSGDGGLALQANFNMPLSLAIDELGNIYIADYYNCRIRKVDVASGIITTFAGNGIASYSGDGGNARNAGIPYPNSICFDTKGNLYISESFSSNSCRIRKIDANTGIITTIAGNNTYAHGGDGGLAINASLFGPAGVIVDNSGNVYIAQYDDSRIRKIDIATGIINTIAGNGVNGFSGDYGIATNAMLNSPRGMAFDNNGDLLICDSKNMRIRKLYMHATSPPATQPSITITASTNVICNNANITFTATTGDVIPSASYKWTKNGNVVGTNNAQWVGSDLKNGDIISCMLQYSICGNTTTIQSNTITLTGNSSEPLSITIVADKYSICENENVLFTAIAKNTSSELSYQWKLNNNNVGTNIATYSNSTLSDGDIVSCELTATSTPCYAGEIKVSNNISIQVKNAIPPTITISSSKDKICAGATVTFHANVRNGGENPMYQWKLNGTNIGENKEDFTINKLINNDKVFCLITNPNSCAESTISNHISLPVENLPIIKLLPLDTIVNFGSQIQLQAIIEGPFVSYTWTPLSSIDNVYSLRPITIPLQKTTNFSLNVITAGNCASSTSTIVTVANKLYMPTAFTPNKDGKNDIYRIPTKSAFILKNFSIFNRWGEKVFSTSNIDKGWDGTFKNVNQNTGTYIYIISGLGAQGPIVLKGAFTLLR